GATPASSTPPGSTPALALSGCTTSQTEVAQMLQRLKLMDGVAEVALHSSTQAASASGGAGASGGSGGGACGGKVSFSVTVTFAALPSTPLPNVAPATPAATPASSTTAKGAHAQQVALRKKGARR
ncbi:MAG: hypothetical protein ACRDK4_11805, partial [Solirubrobacteraceae bacterium]